MSFIGGVKGGSANPENRTFWLFKPGTRSGFPLKTRKTVTTEKTQTRKPVWCIQGLTCIIDVLWCAEGLADYSETLNEIKFHRQKHERRDWLRPLLPQAIKGCQNRVCDRDFLKISKWLITLVWNVWWQAWYHSLCYCILMNGKALCNILQDFEFYVCGF